MANKVLHYYDIAAFPAVGAPNTIYIADDTRIAYSYGNGIFLKHQPFFSGSNGRDYPKAGFGKKATYQKAINARTMEASETTAAGMTTLETTVQQVASDVAAIKVKQGA